MDLDLLYQKGVGLGIKQSSGKAMLKLAQVGSLYWC